MEAAASNEVLGDWSSADYLAMNMSGWSEDYSLPAYSTTDTMNGVLGDPNLAGCPATGGMNGILGDPSLVGNFAIDAMNAVLEDYSRAEHPAVKEDDALDEIHAENNFVEYPATDTFLDQSVAHWPTVTCSELGSKRIRLVKIIPGPPGSRVEFKVNNSFLDQAPSYTALSYTWGSPWAFAKSLSTVSHTVFRRISGDSWIKPGIFRI